jgi:lysyl-tRNA synthetase class 2
MKTMDIERTEQELIRIEKMQALKDKGVEPFGSAFKRSHRSLEIIELYQDKSKEELTELNQKVIIAGRIMTKRDMGKAGFMHLADRDGQMQVYVRKDALSDLEFEVFTLADLGDIFGVEGVVVRKVCVSVPRSRDCCIWL